MITKIVLDNIWSNGETQEFSFPGSIILNSESTYDEWYGFPKKIEIIKSMKTLFSNQGFPKFWSDEEKESTLEIEFMLEEKSYKYTSVFYKSEMVMESMLGNHGWVFSRYNDNPDFALNCGYLNTKGKILYKNYKELFNISSLSCFTVGERMIEEIENIIVVDEWMKMDTYFISNFTAKFPDLDFFDIVNNTVINKLGFSDEYEKITKEGTLISKLFEGIEMPLELAGSGFNRLVKLVPLMIASKKHGLILVSSDPIDMHLHPGLSRPLLEWYLKDNKTPLITRVHNIKL